MTIELEEEDVLAACRAWCVSRNLVVTGAEVSGVVRVFARPRAAAAGVPEGWGSLVSRVGSEFGFSAERLLRRQGRKRRDRVVCEARFALVWLAWEAFELTGKRLAELMGYEHGESVRYARRQCEALRASDPVYAAKVSAAAEGWKRNCAE